MRVLTALEKKRENDDPFTKDDLVLLYEINGTIEGFGYEKDPRIAELRQGRNTEEDMLVIFECARKDIAHVPSQINENTKAYVGQLEPGIFQRLPEHLEHVYTSFPDKKIRRECRDRRQVRRATHIRNGSGRHQYFRLRQVDVKE